MNFIALVKSEWYNSSDPTKNIPTKELLRMCLKFDGIWVRQMAIEDEPTVHPTSQRIIDVCKVFELETGWSRWLFPGWYPPRSPWGNLGWHGAWTNPGYIEQTALVIMDEGSRLGVDTIRFDAEPGYGKANPLDIYKGTPPNSVLMDDLRSAFNVAAARLVTLPRYVTGPVGSSNPATYSWAHGEAKQTNIAWFWAAGRYQNSPPPQFPTWVQDNPRKYRQLVVCPEGAPPFGNSIPFTPTSAKAVPDAPDVLACIVDCQSQSDFVAVATAW